MWINFAPNEVCWNVKRHALYAELSSYPGYFWEPHWKSNEALGIIQGNLTALYMGLSASWSCLPFYLSRIIQPMIFARSYAGISLSIDTLTWNKPHLLLTWRFYHLINGPFSTANIHIIRDHSIMLILETTCLGNKHVIIIKAEPHNWLNSTCLPQIYHIS